MKQQASAAGPAWGSLAKSSSGSDEAARSESVEHAAEAEAHPRIAGLLTRFRKHTRLLALPIFLADLAVYLGCIAGFFLAPNGGWRVAAVLGCGLAIALLFIVGHDCGHLSFSGSPMLDKWLGRMAMLPSFHAFSLWVRTHNRLHHGFTNLRPYDVVFAPRSKQEYDGFPRWRRLLERVYRHPLGLGVYYFIELWLRRFLIPWPGSGLRTTLTHVLDSVLVLAFIGAQLGAIVWASQATGLPVWQGVLGLFVLPLVLWNNLMAFALYNNHTHESIAWYNKRAEWSFFEAQVGGTTRMEWPRPLDVLFHTLMQHTAHHVDPHVPVYRLAQAQAFLEGEYADAVPVVRLTVRGFFETTRRCKLYDFERHCWTDFAGQPTTSPAA